MSSKLNVPLGRWFGIPVFLHWSWMVMFLLVLITSPAIVPLYIALFVLVLLHELGHCLAARSFGAPTRDIMLWPFGGIASVDMPVQPKAELCGAGWSSSKRCSGAGVFPATGTGLQFLEFVGLL